jgi:hypothetical protein
MNVYVIYVVTYLVAKKIEFIFETTNFFVLFFV